MFNFALLSTDRILKRWRVSHSHLDYYDLELQFIQPLGVVGSKEECEHMRSIIDNAMKSRIEEYQESITNHDNSIESDL